MSYYKFVFLGVVLLLSACGAPSRSEENGVPDTLDETSEVTDTSQMDHVSGTDQQDKLFS